MKQIKQFMKKLPEDMTLTRLDFFLSVIIGALIGTIFGMLISPRKHTHIGCDNGNSMNFGQDGELEDL